MDLRFAFLAFQANIKRAVLNLSVMIAQQELSQVSQKHIQIVTSAPQEDLRTPQGRHHVSNAYRGLIKMKWVTNSARNVQLVDARRILGLQAALTVMQAHINQWRDPPCVSHACLVDISFTSQMQRNV